MTAARLRLYAKLQTAAHAVKKAADRALLDAAGVTTAQAAVLAVVKAVATGGRGDEGGGGDEDEDKRGPTQKAVAEALGLNESAVTAMANRLIALGYLTREKDARDGRARRLALTPAGEAAMHRIKAPFDEINAAIEDALGTDDLAGFANWLDALARAFRGQ